MTNDELKLKITLELESDFFCVDPCLIRVNPRS